jgi:hypothetical protein
MLALTSGSPPIPIFLLLPTMLLFCVLVVVLCLRVGASTRFLILAFALRLAMSAMPKFSFASSPLGLSWNALASVVLVLIGSLLLLRSRAVPLILAPVVPLLLVIVMSAMLNGEASGAVESLVKYAYLAIIALTAYDAFMADGAGKVLLRLLFTFLLPLLLQGFSLVLHIAKATESDGSTSYIGGYNHEASFSIILLTGLLTAILNPRLRGLYKLTIAAICLGGIFAANYRTAIITAGPLMLGLFIASITGAVRPAQRPIATILGVLLLLSAVPVLPIVAGDRFDAIKTLVQNPAILSKDPGEFSRADQALLSGRLLLWSQYVNAWEAGTPPQHMLGFGANAWEGRYRYYAHNTLISTLYELGVLGVAAMLLLWIWMFVLALTARTPARFTLVMAHLGFFLLNMATMPFWMIEGLLFYGLLCGFTVHARLQGRAAQRSVANRATLRPV